VSAYSQVSVCRNAVRSAACAGESKRPESPQLCNAITAAPKEMLEQSEAATVNIPNSFNGFAELKASPTILRSRKLELKSVPSNPNPHRSPTH
jgi:hypothetical protein